VRAEERAAWRILRAASGPGDAAKAQLDRQTIEAVNAALDAAAFAVESMSLYDDYDESTRDAAAEKVRSLKVEPSLKKVD